MHSKATVNKISIVLLRSMRKLGTLHTVVKVRKGFAKNFLIPNKFACLATDTNLNSMESAKAQLEHQDISLLSAAETLKLKLDGMKFIFYCKTRDAQNIYGSISAQNIATKLNSGGFEINKAQILLGNNLKTLGSHEVKISLYGHIETNIIINIKSIADEHSDKQIHATKQ